MMVRNLRYDEKPRRDCEAKDTFRDLYGHLRFAVRAQDVLDVARRNCRYNGQKQLGFARSVDRYLQKHLCAVRQGPQQQDRRSLTDWKTHERVRKFV